MENKKENKYTSTEASVTAETVADVQSKGKTKKH